MKIRDFPRVLVNLSSMKFHTPVDRHHKEVIIIEFASTADALKYANQISKSTEIIELISFAGTGASLILNNHEITNNNSTLKEFKQKYKLKYPQESLRSFYNLTTPTTSAGLIFIENFSFVDLFEILDHCIEKELTVLEIKNSRTHVTNSILIGFSNLNPETEKFIERFKGHIEKKISDSLRAFLDATVPS